MNGYKNFKTAYGLTDECFNIPCDPVINEQADCKINVINWADTMIRNLNTIKIKFRNAPVNSDEEHLKVMKAVASRLEVVRDELGHVLDS